MLTKTRLVTLAAVSAAIAIGTPVATASAASPHSASPHCPVGYNGPTNPATGCPYTVMQTS